MQSDKMPATRVLCRWLIEFERLFSQKETLDHNCRASEFVKGCQMPAPAAMHWQSGTRIRGQASDKPRGTKPQGAGRVFQCAAVLWGFE
jgi:hypothetical protein